MVMAWSVDRLGRSLQDLVSFLSELHALHRAGVNAKALGNAAYTLASALALVQSGKDALSPSIR